MTLRDAKRLIQTVLAKEALTGTCIPRCLHAPVLTDVFSASRLFPALTGEAILGIEVLGP